jgi:hypothetical protein
VKISKRVREQAAVLCAQMASWWAARTRYETWEESPVKQVDGTHAGRVACAAQRFASGTRYDGIYCDFGSYVAEWAEAEAMLRTGWEP